MFVYGYHHNILLVIGVSSEESVRKARKPIRIMINDRNIAMNDAEGLMTLTARFSPTGIQHAGFLRVLQ